jgi:putative ABC transport system substrate-binding protein
MKRREFITLLGGAAAWPLAARAQQLGGPKRVALLAPFSDDHDPLVQRYLSAFKQRLHELGWIEARNIQVDIRFTGQNADRIRTGAEELIALSPNLIVVWANPAVAILRNVASAPPRTSLLSISKRQRRSASPCRPRCSPAPKAMTR